MNPKLNAIQNNQKSQQKHTNSTKDSIPFRFRIVTSYSAFFFVIILLILYMNASAYRNTRKQYESEAQSALTGNVKLFEKNLGIMEAYCRQLLQDASFRALAGMKADDDGFTGLGLSLSDSLYTGIYPEKLLSVSEIYCYLPDSGYILAPGCFAAADQFYSQSAQYDDRFVDACMKALTSPSGHFRRISLENGGADDGAGYMYVLDAGTLFPDMGTDAVLCFIYNERQLSALLESMNEGLSCLSLSVRGQTDFILSLPADPGTDPVLEDSVSTYVYTSDKTGFTYSFVYPRLSLNFAHPQILYLALFLTVLFGGFILIFLLVRRSMKPVLELLELRQQLQTSEQEKNQLQETMASQRPIIFNSYVRQFLRGMIVSPEEASYAKEFLGLTDEKNIYNGLYIVAYNSAAECQSSPGEYTTLDAFNRIVRGALRQYLGEPLYYFSPSDRTYALIVVGKPGDAKDLIARTSEAVTKLHDDLLDTHGIWLSAGIGKNTDDILNVWESYQQAMEAVNYTGRNHIFSPYESIKKDSSAFYYPNELSTKLIHFITTGNTSQVLELFGLLHQENIEERSLPIPMVQFLLSDIRNTLLKARFALPQNTPKEVIRDLDEAFGQHVSFKLCEDIALRLCKLFTAQTSDPDLVSTIEKYIRENYADPSLGLNKISDEFQISESYFSHLFKEKKGVNFSTYLENMRMSEAARLIRETDISLNELYLCVGYNNANTFRRAFKKVYGITPSAMRDG